MAVSAVSFNSQPTCTDTLDFTNGPGRTAEICFFLDFDPSLTEEQIACLGPVEIKSQAQALGLPALGDTYQFKNEFDLTLFASSIGPVEFNPTNCYSATVCVAYTQPPANNGAITQQPDTIPKTVDIEFIEDSKPGTNFVFVDYCKSDGTLENGPLQFDNDGVFQPPTGPYNNPVIVPGDVGPVRNSAGCPQRRNCLEYRHILRVRSYVQTWNCLWMDNDIGPLAKWNSGPVRIIEEDDFAVLFDCTYPPCTLQFLAPNKTNIVYEGRTYICVDWVLSYDPDGFLIKQLDAGTQAAFVEGVKDPTILNSGGSPGGVIAADDERLERNKTGKRDLGVSSPVMLNGEGVEWCLSNTPGTKPPIYLAYVKQDSKFDFDLLPICG